ncbi:MAG: glycosyltransferase family 39 protein [Chlorobiaceae bacterium]|nr:glycosyltransferase family 39 protein [Chlorobiaceae bacterium]
MAETMKVLLKKVPVFWIVLSLTALLYLINFSVNDIWTENESFYAESVREMTETGNFFEINYNYQPRFNKPPLTYWLIAVSTRLFGMNEFALRLPIVLLAFGTALLVWAMARMLYGEKTAMLAFAMQAISIQFLAGKQYASPEIPLAFFFTLTLYFFLKGHLSARSRNYQFAAVALGLTVLTKGYPYIIVIGGVILLYLFIESDFQWPLFFKKLKELKPISFMTIVTVIGLSWIGLMYLQYGKDFLVVLNKETVERALTRESNGLRELFFYPEVILWSFFPYSPLFVFACFHYLFTIRQRKDIAFGFSWVLVMLIIFTAAKGKIPTYFIQAHPALALISAHFITRYTPQGNVSAIFWNSLFLLPAAAGIILSTAIIIIFKLPVICHLITVAALLLIIIPYFPQKISRIDTSARSDLRYLQPFIGTFSALLIFSAAVLPQLEEHRPVDRIGRVINQVYHIPKDIPIYLQDGLIHNLPFYAERKVIPQAIPGEILKQKAPVLALIQSQDVPASAKPSVIWKGEIYRRRTSESRLLLFIESHLKAKEGNMSGFTDYSLIYKK